MKRIAKKTPGCEDCGGTCYVSTVPCPTCGGKAVMFDSGAELSRFAELVQRQQRGEIRGLRRQVKFPLSIAGRPIKIRSERYKNGRQCVYTADFVYDELTTPDGSSNIPYSRMIVEDSKGFYTDRSRLQMAIFEAQHNMEIRRTGAQKMRKRRKKAA